MVGKLDIADGDNYGFYLRRAKAVAEARDYAGKNGGIADATGIADPIVAGSTVLLSWTTGFGGDGVDSGVLAADTSVADVCALLAERAELLQEIALAAYINDDRGFGVALVPIRDAAPLTDALLTVTPPGP